MPNYDLFYSPAVGPMDILILGSKGNVTLRTADILDVLQNLEIVAMVELITITIITVTLMTLIITIETKSKRLKKFLKKFIKHYYRLLWKCFDIYVDQEDLRTRQWTVKIMWSTICISVFVVVHGLLLNLLSVDSVVTIKPPVINTLRDLFSEDFKHVDPLVLTSLYFYPELMNSNNKRLGKLRSRVKKENCLDLGNLGLSELFKRFEGAAVTGDEVILLSMFMESMGRTPFCFLNYKMTTTLHRSKSIQTGILTTFYNKNIDSRLRLLLDYRIRNYLEFSQVAKDVEHVTLGVLNSNDAGPLSLNITKCMQLEVDKEETCLPPPISWRSLRSTLNLFVFGISVSAFVYSFEKSFKRISQQKRTSNRPNAFIVFLTEQYR